jgi:hypothetical protein
MKYKRFCARKIELKFELNLENEKEKKGLRN